MIKNIAVLKTIFFLSFAYVLMSCASDDPAPEKESDERLIRMHVSPGYYFGDAYLVITDMVDNVLCTQKLSMEQYFVLRESADYFKYYSAKPLVTSAWQQVVVVLK
jgi:hypothetical protein